MTIALRSSHPDADSAPIPVTLIRDLLAVSLLTDSPRTPVRRRLEAALGAELVTRLRPLLERR